MRLLQQNPGDCLADFHDKTGNKTNGAIVRNSKCKSVVLIHKRENTMKNTTTKTVEEEVDANLAHPTLNLQLLTYEETAEQLRVSLRTVRRLVDSGELRCVYIRSSPRIRAVDLQQYLDKATRPSSLSDSDVGLDVRNHFREQRTCQNVTTKMASTKGQSPNTGGSRSSTPMARELANRLGLTTGKKPKSSLPS